MIIDDDFLTLEEQNNVKNFALGSSFPWYFYETTVLDTKEEYDSAGSIKTNDTKEHFQFVHLLGLMGEVRSQHLDFFITNVFEKMTKKHGIEVNNIHRAKLNLVTSMSDEGYQTPHVDHDFPHNVFLYYINDSDGDTIMFNEKFNGTKQELTVLDRISPKMGRGIIFDGLQYHSPNSPKNNNYRAVINISFS